MLYTDWYTHHWNHSESMKHSYWNIWSQFSWKENWYVIFFFTDMKSKQEGKAERNWCCQRAAVAFGCFGLCTSNSHPMGEIQFPLDYTVFLAVKTRTMDPTPPAASAFSCHCSNMALLLSEGSQSLYKYTSLADPRHSCPGTELLFQYR